jgi:hypothetical protein
MMMTVHQSEPDPTPERQLLIAATNLLRRFHCPDAYTTRAAHRLSAELLYFLDLVDSEQVGL